MRSIRAVLVIVLSMFLVGIYSSYVLGEEDNFGLGLEYYERFLKESRTKFEMLTRSLVSGDLLTKLERGIELNALGEHEKASVVFSDIVDRHQRSENEAAYITAELYLSKSLIVLGYYNRAQSLLLDVLSQGYGKEQEEAGHLILSVVQQTRDWEQITPVLLTVWSRFSGTKSGEVFAYIIGRSYFLQGKFDESLKFLQRLSQGSEWELRGSYIRGAIMVSQRELEGAYGHFRYVVEYQSDEEVSRALSHLRDLSYLAMARIRYSQGDWSQALDLYQHVGERSPHYDVVLYEASWTHIRREEMEEARQGFELLALSYPHSRHAAESKRLSYDLARLLGKYDEAMRGYHEILQEYEPILERMKGDSEDEVKSKFISEFKGGERFGSQVFGGSQSYQHIEEQFVGRLNGILNSMQVSAKNQEVSAELIGELDEVVSSDLKMNIFPEYLKFWRNRRSVIIGLLGLRSKLHDECLRDKDLSSSHTSERVALDRKLSLLPRSLDEIKRREENTQVEVGVRREKLHYLKVEIHNMYRQLEVLNKWLSGEGSSLIVQSTDRESKVEESRRLESALKSMMDRVSDIERQIRRKEGIGGSSVEEIQGEEQLFALLASQHALEWEDLKGHGCEDDLMARYTKIWEETEQFGRDVEKGVDIKLARFKLKLEEEKQRYLSEQSRYSDASEALETRVADIGYQYWERVFGYVQRVVKGADVGVVDVSWMRKSDKSKSLGEAMEKRNKDKEEMERDLERYSKESGQNKLGGK